MDNSAILDPDGSVLLVYADINDIQVEREDGRVVIAIVNFTGGIEIVHDDDRLWRPV